MNPSAVLSIILAASIAPLLDAQPFSAGENDSENSFDAPIPGFVGPHGEGLARLESPSQPGTFINPNNYINPIFFGWAFEVVDYSPSPGVNPYFAQFEDDVLGPTTGEVGWVLSLGDLPSPTTDPEPGQSPPQPGTLTIRFKRPIADLDGADFVVFENAFQVQGSAPHATLAELAYVEVSSDGQNFFRFPSVSLTPTPIGPYSPIDPRDVYNLAGKHHNGYGKSWGTPFDLSDLPSSPLLNPSAITHLRLVDVPGYGGFLDSLGNPIYDPHLTFGSGGADIEAIGAISVPITFDQWPLLQTLPPEQRSPEFDPHYNNLTNLAAYAFARLPNQPYQVPVSRLLIVPESETGETYPAIQFNRDQRLSDLTITVEWTTDFQTWHSIARSVGGADLIPLSPHQPLIEEVSASPIRSIGVLRSTTVHSGVPLSVEPIQFFRIDLKLIN